MSMNTGRPRHYKSPAEFDEAVDLYVEHCKDSDGEEPIMWTGLALFMGFSGRAEIDNYLKYDGFSNSVKRAKTIVEAAYEKRLVKDGGAAPIFALKNFGWTDKQELDHTSSDKSMSPMSLHEFYNQADIKS